MLQPLAMALSIALAVPLIHPPTGHAASVKVVATLPILKEFAEQVGREHVEVHSLITGLESEHSYSPKPSDLRRDRKSTRLNSSHVRISYAVFCLNTKT